MIISLHLSNDLLLPLDAHFGLGNVALRQVEIGFSPGRGIVRCWQAPPR